jgi:hypothetical protein
VGQQLAASDSNGSLWLQVAPETPGSYAVNVTGLPDVYGNLTFFVAVEGTQDRNGCRVQLILTVAPDPLTTIVNVTGSIIGAPINVSIEPRNVNNVPFTPELYSTFIAVVRFFNASSTLFEVNGSLSSPVGPYQALFTPSVAERLFLSVELRARLVSVVLQNRTVDIGAGAY